MSMNILNVNYKDKTVAINYHSISINDSTYFVFLREQDNDCKFLCQYLEANRITYEKKEREAYTEIKADTNLFDLDIAIRHPIRSSEIDNNFYKAICHREDDIVNARDIIAKYEDYAARKVDEINALNSREYVNEYRKSLDDTLVEILEFTRCKQLEIVALTKEQLDVSRGTLPVVDEIKVAYHVSEMMSKEDYENVLIIIEYLDNKMKLSKKEYEYLHLLGQVEYYCYPSTIKEINAIGKEKFNEYLCKAKKWMQEDEKIHERIRVKTESMYE